MSNLKTLIVALGMVLCSFPAVFSQSESITITTYYPSPYGSYRELRAQRQAIGITYYSRENVCWDAPCPATAVVPNLSTELVVEGSVSIGSPSIPATNPKLYVVGPVEADGFRAFETNGSYAFLERGVDNDNTVQLGGYNVAFMTFVPTQVDGAPLLLQTRSGGNVGIGTPAPGYRLDVAGDLRITGIPFRNGGDIAWQVPSDARLKDVVKEYGYGLKEIMKIKPVIYRYKKDNPLKIDSGAQHTGVIAQEVQKVIPEAVMPAEKGYLTLNSTPIIWAMLNAIKEQQKEIEALRKELKALK